MTRRTDRAENRLRLLYHYVSGSELATVVARGSLLPNEDGAVGRRLLRSPGVVWLTDAEQTELGGAQGAGGTLAGLPNATPAEVRITVSVFDAQFWPRWATRHRIGRRDRAAIDEASAGRSARLWVVARPIPTSEWVRVERMHTDG